MISPLEGGIFGENPVWDGGAEKFDEALPGVGDIDQ